MIRVLAALVILALSACSTAPVPPAPSPSASGPFAPPPPPAKSHLAFRREADEAFKAKNYTAAISATQSALALRPDSPRYLYNLACAYALVHRPADGLAALQRLAELGVVVDLEKDPDLATVRALPGFAGVRAVMDRNGQPRGKIAPVFDLPKRSGIIEGIAFQPETDAYFLGDVRERCVWRSSREGRISRFGAADAGLLGVFKVVVDEPHGLLWASTSALPEIAGYTPALKGQGALVALDLKTGQVVRNYPLPADGRDHCLGDFAIAADGTILVPDSVAPVIWQLAPGGDHLEVYLEYRGFVSLQGIGFLDQDRKLVVSDYTNGLFIIDRATRQVTPVAPGTHATLLGIDTLLVRHDSVLAVQNGIEPQRVIHVSFNGALDRVTHVDVLAAALPNFTDLTHAAIVDGWLMVVAKSGWDDFDRAKGDPPPHDVHIVALALP